MKFKLKGNDILNTHFISPDIPYATFSDEITHATKKEIVLTLNYGGEMLDLYRRYRDDMHIKNVVDLLEQMEVLFREYSYAVYSAKRKERS